jgi:excisionase family DNA binding protein
MGRHHCRPRLRTTYRMMSAVAFVAFRGIVTGMSELIRTGEAAKILGTSRQHVVDLSNRGVLRSRRVGVHRRLDRAEVEALVTEPLRRDARQSLWLHRAVAGRVVTEPATSLAKARKNLQTMRSANPSSSHWLGDWERILDRGPEEVARMLTAESPEAVELRQNSPFAGVLSDRARRRALSAFRADDRARVS